MSQTFLEIVELSSGEIVLRRTDDTEETLVSISFSDEAKSIIGDEGLDIAKVMIQAGIQATAHLTEMREAKADEKKDEFEGASLADLDDENRVLH